MTNNNQDEIREALKRPDWSMIRASRNRFDGWCEQFESEISEDAIRFACEVFSDLDESWRKEYVNQRNDLKAAYTHLSEENERLRELLLAALPYVRDGQLADAGAAHHASNMGLGSHSLHSQTAQYGKDLIKEINEALQPTNKEK